MRALCHFTTHTPVPAGHDHFSLDRCRKLLHGLLPENLNLPSWVQDSRLHMTELGLYFSGSANGVSELHGKVAQDQFPDFEINYITNGVYHPYWLGKSYEKMNNKKESLKWYEEATKYLTTYYGQLAFMELNPNKTFELTKDIEVSKDKLTDVATRLSAAEATWEMAENLYRRLADQVREHEYDIKDLNR